MNVFSQTDYRTILKQLLEERRRDEPAVSYQDLALAMNIPKSYLSKVMHGRADVSADQMFLAARYFRLNPEEREYLDLLLTLARTSIDEKRQVVGERIESMRRRHLDTRTHLKAEMIAPQNDFRDYYLDPVHQLVHAALDIPEFQNSLKTLADRFGIALSRVQDAAQNLERIGVVEREEGRLVVKKSALHLPKESAIYDSWRAQLRLLGLQRSQAIPKDEHYAFAVVFSAGTTSDQAIKARFFEFLKQLEKEVGEAQSERVYQLNFDLLPWT